MSDKKTIISAQNVAKHFNGGQIKALDGISADIYKGKVVVIIGPSGSGKSTFLRCMNLLEVPTGGSILFNDTDTHNQLRHDHIVLSGSIGQSAYPAMSSFWCFSLLMLEISYFNDRLIQGINGKNLKLQEWQCQGLKPNNIF